MFFILHVNQLEYYRSNFFLFFFSLAGAEATYVYLQVQCHRGHQFLVRFSSSVQILESCLLFSGYPSSHRESGCLTFSCMIPA